MVSGDEIGGQSRQSPRRVEDGKMIATRLFDETGVRELARHAMGTLRMRGRIGPARDDQRRVTSRPVMSKHMIA
jgi:hypothetical protein